MTRLLLVILLTCIFLCLFAQSPCEIPQKHFIQSNRIGAYVFNDGSLFHNEDKGGFKIPYSGNESPSTIGRAYLWLGGFDPGGNLKLAAAGYGTQNGLSDFHSGPLDPTTGLPYSDIPCEYFNQIWTVTSDDIFLFLDDWKDNGEIDDEHRSVFNWPGAGNPFWNQVILPETPQGWAPFYDQNLDKIYNPMDGDFPALQYGIEILIPKEMNWCVYNDAGEHLLTGALPIRIEVQQTTYVLDCDSQPEVENSVFVHYKFINRAFEDIDTFYAGIAMDLDIGCPGDDKFGSIPSLNSFYAYNNIQNDGGVDGCGENQGYGDFPPVMGVRFFEYPSFSSLEHVMYYLTGSAPHAGYSTPENPEDFYNYLTGSWRDGTPLTYGGSGYSQTSINYTDFIFPGNPNHNNEWTYNVPVDDPTGNEVITLGSTGFHNPWFNIHGSIIQPGKNLEMTVAFSCFSQHGFNHIEMIDKMISDDLRNLEDAVFPDYHQNVLNGPYCQSYSIEELEEEEEIPFISGIYPNPTTGELTIAIPETTIQEVAVYNTAWQLLYFDKTPKEEVQTIDLQEFAQGLYFVRLKLDGQTLVRKVVVR